MKKNFAIIGLGRFGASVCETLIEYGQEVLVIDRDEARVNDYMDIATHAVVADAQDDEALKSIGIRNFDHVIVAIGEDIQASILVTLMVKELGVPVVTAKALNEYHARVLQKVGADHIVHPERDMGIKLGRALSSNHLLDYLDLDDDYRLAEIDMTDPRYVNKTLDELNFRSTFNLNVISIRRGKEMIISPLADQIILPNDQVLIIGETKAVTEFDEKMNKTK